jgi:hypothetical protein
MAVKTGLAHVHAKGELVPVRVEMTIQDEIDLATPGEEITSRHRIDRRSLLPPRRVRPQRGMPSAASAETPLKPLDQSMVAHANAPPSLASRRSYGGFVVRRVSGRMPD